MIIKVSDLNINDIQSLGLKETITIESQGKIVMDTWEDIPKVLDIFFEDNVCELWENSWTKCFKLNLSNKVFSLFHGNTKWFSLTRII